VAGFRKEGGFVSEFVTDLKAIQKRAREQMEKGAVMAYRGDRQKVLQLLNEALATELVCVLRYRRHYETAQGINADTVAAEFLEHANQEQEHADKLARRIGQLQGEPDYNPDTLSKRSHTQYIECTDLMQMIKENLIAERIAIETYGEMIRYIGDADPTTRRLLEVILEQEEEHADDLSKFLQNISPESLSRAS